MQDTSIACGTKLGRYEIPSKIGEGGMGEVYHSGLLPRIRWYLPYESLHGDARYADLRRRMGVKP